MVEWIVKRAQGDRARVGTLTGVVCIIANVALCAAKGAIGVISGSVSIVADAMNNLSDASSNIVSVLGFKLASRPADPEHPYGHGRYEYLSGLVVAALVLLIGLELIKSSVERIIHPVLSPRRCMRRLRIPRTMFLPRVLCWHVRLFLR